MTKTDRDKIMLAEHVLEVRHEASGTFLDVRGYVADYIRREKFLPHWKDHKGTLMKTITLHPLVNVVEGFYASESEIRRTWDTSPCDGTGNGRLPDIP